MDKPDVTLENSDAVYDYYLGHQQNRLLAKAAYATLAARFRPRIRYAEGTRERLRELVRSNTRVVLAVNHLTERDPYTVAGAAWRSPLRPVIGRTRVLAKDELFAEPKRRDRIDLMGSIPVFRGKNHGMRAVNAAGQRMMDVCAERLRRGDDLAIFPEGTCNEDDPARLQRIGSGIGHITSRAIKLGVRPALVCMGISYGPGVDRHADDAAVRGASVFFATPVLDLPDKPAEIARLVQAGLQDAVDGAVARY
ncbi:lysophospholipid acyltransferase family protein [Rhodococcus sp. NPDC059234]|uniref:lysophospholipid acyltransferase family protein n=1 Tax=Rhodococcus sp. NPDC059234 TaxID=3346781 RepID=UPI00366C7A5C